MGGEPTLNLRSKEGELRSRRPHKHQNFEINFTNLKKDGGESDARDLASELFLAGKTPEEENMKDSSLNGSLESLEHDQQQHDR